MELRANRGLTAEFEKLERAIRVVRQGPMRDQMPAILDDRIHQMDSLLYEP